jgi:hypothetical protein
MLIGHLVPRDPDIFSATDASKQGIGVVIDTTQTLCFLPIHPDVARRLDLPAKHPDKLDINIFKFLGLLLAFIMTHLSVLARPSDFPPTPILHVDCDNTSAIAWLSKMSTCSAFGQALLRLFAELSLSSPVGAAPVHLATLLATSTFGLISSLAHASSTLPILSHPSIVHFLATLPRSASAFPS